MKYYIVFDSEGQEICFPWRANGEIAVYDSLEDANAMCKKLHDAFNFTKPYFEDCFGEGCFKFYLSEPTANYSAEFECSVVSEEDLDAFKEEFDFIKWI